MMRRLCAVLFAVAAVTTVAGCGGGGAGDLAMPDDAQKSASGLAWKVLKTGTGTDHPAPTSQVRVHYTGWTMDGKQFASSLDTGDPLVHAVNRFIPGWTEGLQLMVKGEQRRFWIPAGLAYEGKSGPQGMLVFDVELLDFK